MGGFLDPDGTARILFVHGPGGIGKSNLARCAPAAGERLGYSCHWVDGREVAPLPEALDEALAEALAAPRPLVVIDSYERIGALDGHLRGELLPRLPDASRVVIAGREVPAPGWREAGWQALVGELRLDPMSDPDARELLRAHGVTEGAMGRLVGWAAGSPLALTLAAASVGNARSGDVVDLEGPEVVEPLIRSLAAPGSAAGHLPTLGVAGIARQVTREMLADVLDEDPGAELDWLASRSFVESLGDGVAAHEVARRALRADLQRREPMLERLLRRRIADHLHARALATGNALLAIDLAALARSPSLLMGFSWEAASAGRYRVDDVRPGDRALVARAIGEEDLRLEGASRFMVEAPEHVSICRDPTGAVRGFATAVTPASAPTFAAEDPVLGPRLEHARSQALLGEAIVWRSNRDLDLDLGSGVVALLGVASLLRATSGNPRFGYLPIVAGHPAREFAAAAGAEHVPELDADLEGTVVECHLLDWGEGGLLTAQRDVVYRELNLIPPPPPPLRGLGVESVREALRSLDDPRELARCELAANDLAAGGDWRERAAAVREAIEVAIERSFADGARDRLLRSVLESNYLDPTVSPELAAERLHLSRATYFRRLREAVGRLTETLARAG